MLLQLLWMLVTSKGVNGEILRLSCKTFANFSVVLQDRSLSAAFRTFDSLDEYTCKFECIQEQRCKSINVNEELGACQLNNKSAQDPNDGIETQAAAGWTYYSTRYDELHVGQLCQSEHPCRTGEKCIDTCTCPGYKCLDIDECKNGLHDCHQHAICTNNYGSFSCQCRSGFTGHGKNCSAENIAHRRPSSSSSVHTYGKYTFSASHGNDGNSTGDWQMCSITKPDNMPWWQVDLTKQAAVSSVRIKSGQNWNSHRINPFNVSVGDDSSNGGRNNALCVNGGILNAGEFKYFTCPTVLHGRYVTVFLNRNEYLLVCEVEIYESIIGTQ